MEQRLKQLWSDVQSWFLRLTERERVMVAAAAAMVGVFVLFVVFFSFSTSMSRTRSRTEAKRQKLAQAEALAASYAEAESSRREVERQLSSSGISLISYIEEKGEQAGLRIPTMNPKGEVPVGEEGRILESSVELTLTDVSLRSLHQFLTSVESGPGVVKVKYLRLEPRADNQTLTAWATISTYRLKPQ